MTKPKTGGWKSPAKSGASRKRVYKPRIDVNAENSRRLIKGRLNKIEATLLVCKEAFSMIDKRLAEIEEIIHQFILLDTEVEFPRPDAGRPVLSDFGNEKE